MHKDNSTFIIGGAGFVGNRLTAYLDRQNKKYRVGDLNDHCENVTKLDVEDPASLDCIAGFDCIINLAAVHRDDIRPLSRYDDVTFKAPLTFAQQLGNTKLKKLYLRAQLQFTDLHRQIPTNQESQIILMIMAELNIWRNRFTRNGKLRSQKIVALL